MRCNSKGETSKNYEKCMIDFVEAQNLNSTQFCISHYSNKTVWKGSEIAFEGQDFYQRKHECMNLTGISLGRQYCEDVFQNNQDSKLQLYSCFRQYQVDFGEQYCSDLFIDTQTEGLNNTAAYYHCLVKQGLKHGSYHCELEFQIDLMYNSEWNVDYTLPRYLDQVKERLDCYDREEILDFKYCDLSDRYNTSQLNPVASDI